MIGVGERFPHFNLKGVDENNEFVDVSVTEHYEPLKHDFTVIYFYPKDFTFICPTEILGMDILVDDANVIGISGDNEFCKLAWKQTNKLIDGIHHSLAADCGLGLSSKLGIVDEDEGVCYRATYIIDRNDIPANECLFLYTYCSTSCQSSTSIVLDTLCRTPLSAHNSIFVPAFTQCC